MASVAETAEQTSLRRRLAQWCLILACLFPCLLGCEGCQQAAPLPEGEQENAAAFSGSPIKTFPAGTSANESSLKPGHWFSAAKPLRANREDVRGSIQVTAGQRIKLDSGKIERIHQPLIAERPAVLPKGQRKQLDFRLLAPLSSRLSDRSGYLRDTLMTRNQSVAYDSGERAIPLLRPEQYFVAVMTTRPERFVSVQVADWVKPPRDPNAFTTGSQPTNYRVIFPPTEDLVPLPETMLDWTSIAFVIWDDVSVDRLTPGQQQALTDWLNWGGHMVVNGRYADESFGETPLADLLPMHSLKLVELEGAPFVELLENWSVDKDPTTAAQVAQATKIQGNVAIDGVQHPNTKTIPNTGELVLTRRRGLGNVVMTRFDITTDLVQNWASRDSFYNNLMLQRPPREYTEDAGNIMLRFAGHPAASTVPAEVNSPLRLFSRDGILGGTPETTEASEESTTLEELTAATAPDSNDDQAVRAARSSLSQDLQAAPAFVSEPMGGVGAWTDRSNVASVAMQSLTEQSGISIPPASFVARSLAWYLLILVPLNYLFFRLIGRLEYAWLAVPVIAVGGAIWVARAARLDIGFARLENEIGLLEMQPEYDRAHLSSFIAIYSSLGTDYQIAFDSPDAAGLPVGQNNSTDGSAPVRLQMGYGEGPILSGIQVASNQTRLVHTEQIVPAGGFFRWTAENNKLANGSDLVLTNAVVVRRGDEGQITIADLGDFPSGATRTVEFASEELHDLLTWAEPLRPLVQGLLSPAGMQRGEVRLVAAIEEAPSKMRIEPQASQANRATVLLAHLQYPGLPEPKKDTNLPPKPKERVDDLMLDQALESPEKAN
ncbi:hypothetical protein FF011L_08940 [Roseimaritima multifibrata]|uniref:Uncharacterized protein n=1 Tax=Roseimaritima multifibrata TaxID=1930274 RepID=A0A517MB93_9BACT|nr:hypothetical protein FF011L_08940 [Roseimaritima multifibrata]